MMFLPETADFSFLKASLSARPSVLACTAQAFEPRRDLIRHNGRERAQCHHLEVGEIAAHVMHSSQRSLSFSCAVLPGLWTRSSPKRNFSSRRLRTAHQSPMMDKRRIDNNRAGDAVRTD
jgi:hypothetical protein